MQHIKTDAYIYVGGKGKRGPTSSSATNASGGIGHRHGGNGDWGTSNWSMGGGGASEIHFGSLDCRSIVAGGGGGTFKSKTCWNGGKGGNGGCTSETDSRCFGKSSDSKTFSSGATESSGNGASSAKNKEQGGGGAGYIGGSAGSQSHVGGNGGTSKFNTGCYSYRYEDVTTHIGGISGDGRVWIEVVK